MDGGRKFQMEKSMINLLAVLCPEGRRREEHPEEVSW